MKRILLATTLVSILGVGGIVAAQATKPDEHAAHHPGGAAAAPDTQSAPGAMGGGMMGHGMMGGGMMGGGMCPMMGGGMMGGGMMGGMMGGAKTKVEVKKIDKGVTITMTSPDAATAARIQKMAEAMRLMHEAMSQ